MGPKCVLPSLIRRAGIPCSLEEIARLVRQLERSGDRLLADRLQDLLTSGASQSLHSIIQYRIDHLQRSTRDVLKHASVLGHRFAPRIVALFETIRENLVEHLALLRGLQFLDEYPPPPDWEYAFCHPLAREVAYQNLTVPQRRRLHGEIAEKMEDHFARESRLSTYYETLAFHFEKAGKTEKAFYYAVKSAERAVALCANREALRWYEKSLELLTATGNGRNRRIREASLLSGLGRLRRILGDVATSEKSLKRAADIALADRNTHLQAECAYEMAALYQATSSYVLAARCATEALHLSRMQKRHALQAQCHNMLGMIAWGESQLDQALVEYQNVFDLSVENVAPGMVADAHNNAGLVHLQRGNYRLALAEMQQCLRLGHRMGDRYRIAATVMNIGILQERLGRLEAARRAYSNALNLSEDIGFRQAACACLANLSNVDLIEQKPRDAANHAAQSLDIARAIGDRRSEAIAEENLGLASLATVDYKSARSHFNKALGLARKLGDVERQVSVGLGLVELNLAAHPKPSAATRIRSLLETIERQGFRDHLPRALRDLGRVLARQPHRSEDAEIALRRALEVARKISNIPEREACRREMVALRIRPKEEK